MDRDEELGIERLPDAVYVPGVPKWQLFATYYVETGDRVQSAIRAGFSARRASQTAYDLMKKPYVQKFIEERLRAGQERAERRMGEQSVGQVAWIIEKAAQVVEDAPKAGQYAAAVSALNLLAKMHPQFNGGPSVDARSVNLNLPPGTSVSDLKALVGGFQRQLGGDSSGGEA